MFRFLMSLIMLCALAVPLTGISATEQPSLTPSGDDLADKEAHKAARTEKRSAEKKLKQEEKQARKEASELEQLEKIHKKREWAKAAGFESGDPAAPARTTEMQAYESVPAKHVNYDKASDLLSVEAEAASLRLVLGRIAQLSGIEVLFDEQANAPVSFTIESKPLEAGLSQILKGRNSAMRYSKSDNGELLLVGVTVLPAGEQGSGYARRLMAMENEAYYRARNMPTIEQMAAMDKSKQRWQARLDEMTPERRQVMEKRVDERLLKQAMRDQRKAERKAKKQVSSETRKETRAAKREQALQSLTPEQRANFEKSSEISREQMRAILTNPR